MIAILLALVAHGDEFADCVKALENGEPSVRNHSGCAARAWDRERGTETTSWSVPMARARLLEFREQVVRHVRRTVDDCPGIGVRERFPMPTFQICNFVAGARNFTVHDERDLVTGATAASDLAVLRHTSPVPMRLGPDPVVIEHEYAAGMARYRITLRAPKGSEAEPICLTARDRWVGHVESLTLREEEQVRIWELELGWLACMPSRGAEGDQADCTCEESASD